MSNDAYAIALKNGLDEIRNVCPGISGILVFNENGKVLIEDENISRQAASNAQDTLRVMAERADILGGVESITVRGTQASVNIARFEDFYIADVCSPETDEKTVNNLTRVMIPTMLKMAKKMSVLQEPEFQPKDFGPKTHSESSVDVQAEPKIRFPTPETLEFTVESLNVFGGLQTDSDTAYVDSGLVAQWREMFGDENVVRVTLENAATKKETVCKFAPFKDSKHDGKGVIQLPKKIQEDLGAHKGAHIRITPIIGAAEEEEEKPEAVADGNIREAPQKENNAPANQPTKKEQSSPFSSGGSNIQFIVENFGGINLVRNPDFVRVEPAMMERWKELFGNKEIKQVIIEETISGKRISCKCQPIKNSELEGKGVVQMPEKMQQALKVKKGGLVLVKPVVD